MVSSKAKRCLKLKDKTCTILIIVDTAALVFVFAPLGFSIAACIGMHATHRVADLFWIPMEQAVRQEGEPNLAERVGSVACQLQTGVVWLATLGSRPRQAWSQVHR